MNITKEYIAGFVDGEGYFGLIKKTKPDCLNGYYYTPVLKIAQITQNEEVLKQISTFIGYGNYWRSKLKNNNRNATSLEFRGMKRVIPIAKQLLPYLIVKKKQAELIIKLEESQKEITNANRTEVDTFRQNIYDQLRVLNKRGLAETKRKDTQKVMQ